MFGRSVRRTNFYPPISRLVMRRPGTAISAARSSAIWREESTAFSPTFLQSACGFGIAIPSAPDLHFRSPARAPAADGHQFPRKKAARAIVAAGFPLQLQAVFAIRPFHERGVFFHVHLRGVFHVTQGNGGGILDVEFLGLGGARLPSARACCGDCQRQRLHQCTAGQRAIYHEPSPRLWARSTMQKSSGGVTFDDNVMLADLDVPCLE